MKARFSLTASFFFKNLLLLWSFQTFLWISSNSCPLNLLLVRSHQGGVIIVKHLIQGRNNVTRVRVERRSCDQGYRRSDRLVLSNFTITSTIYLQSLMRVSLSFVLPRNFYAEPFFAISSPSLNSGPKLGL